MHNGFTLIELVVVVFMIGILVTMSTGVVYFLLWQYPESLGNIGDINKSYSSVANDLLLERGMWGLQLSSPLPLTLSLCPVMLQPNYGTLLTV